MIHKIINYFDLFNLWRIPFSISVFIWWRAATL